MTQSLLAIVVCHLNNRRIPHALIGAAALAVHGVARSTFDLDLLTTDVRVLEADFWRGLGDARVSVKVRPGDADDPLAGVVRIEAAGERALDVVVGRGGWQDAVVDRSEPVDLEDVVLPVVRASDLILLKLYAGGSQDAWDIEQLLASQDRRRLIADVEGGIADLPAAARTMWDHVRG